MEDSKAYETLRQRALDGAQWRYGRISPELLERFDRELDLIRDKGFAHYFLVVEELARRSDRTCGRGSAAASLVAYCLGITHVDPMKHNLFFERFLNEGRVDPPDIDVDFPWDERDDILDFAFARYGSRRTAMVANQVSYVDWLLIASVSARPVRFVMDDSFLGNSLIRAVARRWTASCTPAPWPWSACRSG